MKVIAGKFREEKIIIKVWIIVMLMFTGLLSYFQMGEENQLINQRKIDENIYSQETEKIVGEDIEAPLGIVKNYKIQLGELENGENCLAFYVRHQYVKVTIEGEVVYLLKAPEGKKIGKTVGSDWVIIPLFPRDKGKCIEVEITPVYEGMVNWEPEFKMGTHYNIFKEIIRDELLILIICILCIASGFLLIAMQLSYYYRHKANERNLIYLGIFSIMLGILKVADLRIAPILLNLNPKLLFYITIGMIPLAGVPIIYYIKSFIKGCKSQLLDLVSWLNVIFSGIAIVLQIFNVLDLRENLIFMHLLSGLVLVSLTFEIVRNWMRHKLDSSSFSFWGLPMLIVGGGLWDMLNFMNNRSTEGVYHIIIGFFLYVVVMWVRSISESRRKAYTDFQTGLFNKSQCNEMLEETGVPETPTGVIMIDLNFLKYTNDKYGHEAGDLYISDFAAILRECVPMGNFIGRFGGDEFVVVVYMTDEEQLRTIIKKIQNKVEEENENGRDPQISYSLGHAISTHYPGMTLSELLEVADQKMYEEKRKHHQKFGVER